MRKKTEVKLDLGNRLVKSKFQIIENLYQIKLCSQQIVLVGAIGQSPLQD